MESSSLRHVGCRRVPADQQTGGGEDKADCQPSDWVTDMTLIVPDPADPPGYSQQRWCGEDIEVIEFVPIPVHYASKKLKFEVISRGTFEWLRRFSEGHKCQTYLTLILKSKQGPKKSSYH